MQVHIDAQPARSLSTAATNATAARYGFRCVTCREPLTFDALALNCACVAMCYESDPATPSASRSISGDARDAQE